MASVISGMLSGNTPDRRTMEIQAERIKSAAVEQLRAKGFKKEFRSWVKDEVTVLLNSRFTPEGGFVMATVRTHEHWADIRLTTPSDVRLLTDAL